MPSRAKVKTTRGAGRANRQSGGQRGGGKVNSDSPAAASNGKERSVRARKKRKEREKGTHR